MQDDAIMKGSDNKGDLPNKSSDVSIPEKAVSIMEIVLSNYLTGFLIVGLVLAVCCDIAVRIVINKSIIGLAEVAQNAMVVITFTTLAAIQKDKAHITMDTIIEKIRYRRSGVIVQFLTTVGELMLFAFMFLCLAHTTLVSYQVKHVTQVIYMPIWPVHLLATLGALALVGRAAMQLKGDLVEMKRPKGTTR